MAPVLDSIAEARAQLMATVNGTIEALRPLADVLPEMTRRQFLAFAAHGWYPDVSMPFATLAEISKRFEGGDLSGGVLCVRYFEGELPHIEARIAAEWPARAPALADAFSAHKQGMFYVSIPTFFAQADGISREGLGKRAFDQRRVPREGDRVWDLVLEAIRLPMTSETPMNQVEKKRSIDFGGVNRHAVMHGDPPLEYGTKENSLQASSFLNYVAAVVRIVADSPP